MFHRGYSIVPAPRQIALKDLCRIGYEMLLEAIKKNSGHIYTTCVKQSVYRYRQLISSLKLDV